jgi:Ca-activated chloride channel family protein
VSEAISNFHFLRPLWLLFLLPSLLLAIALWRQRSRAGSWARVMSPELLPHLLSSESISHSRSGIPFLLIAWCIAALAAAGPSWQQLPQPVLQKQDALVLVMDLSYSMLATDLQPSRQDRVRRKLLDLLRDRREGLTALIAYAGDAHIVAPLTDDNPTIANLLPALTPQMMPLPGSNPVEAVETALALLDSAGALQGRILLVTDGVNEADAISISKLIEGQPRRLAILGVGTEVGAPIPLESGGFLRDGDGDIVVPALNEKPLRQLAALSGASYQRMVVGDSDLQALSDDSLLRDSDDTVALDRRADRWQDMAHWLVLPLLLIALGSFRRGWIYLLPLFITLLPAQPSQALEWQDLWLRADQQGEQALVGGDAERASTLFQNPGWRGTAAWQAGDYESAESAFSLDESARGWYNRGNSLAVQGQLEEAIDAYRKSLELSPAQPDAEKNIETLEQLRDQQQEEQQNEQGDSEQQPADPSEQQDDAEAQEGSQDQQSQSNEQDSDGQEGEQSQEQQQDKEQEQGSQGEEDQSEQPRDPPMPQPDIDNSEMQEDMEKDQAMQQWLRRVPDDPSGLLREKFRYESRQRQQQGKSRESTQIW